MIHDFTCAMIYSGLPLNLADGFIGNVFRKYCPAAKTIPGIHQIACKYLPEVFKSHMMLFKEKMADQKLCMIIDDFSDVIGRPAVNTSIILWSFYKKQECGIDRYEGL